MADQSQPEEVQLQLIWSTPVDLEPVYVDNMLLQKANEQYYVTFGQVRLPVSQAAPANATLEIRPVVRIIVSSQALRGMLEVLNRSIGLKE